jgi:DNA replication protein DnaC
VTFPQAPALPEELDKLMRRMRLPYMRTARTVARICRADLIVIDDIRLLPVGEDAAEAFHRIIDAAWERRSIAVTSNIHPSKAHMFRQTCARWRRSGAGSCSRQARVIWRAAAGHRP